MFGFLKRKIREIKAPVDGEVVALESVDDEVFSKKMVGDGVAIKPVSNIFTAPIEGKVTKIFPTIHAYSIKSDKDLDVMVHIGLDSVALNGTGFERLVNEGDHLACGDGVIKVDMDILRQAKDTITPIIVSDSSDVRMIDKRYSIVKCGDVIMEVQ